MTWHTKGEYARKGMLHARRSYAIDNLIMMTGDRRWPHSANARTPRCCKNENRICTRIHGVIVRWGFLISLALRRDCGWEWENVIRIVFAIVFSECRLPNIKRWHHNTIGNFSTIGSIISIKSIYFSIFAFREFATNYKIHSRWVGDSGTIFDKRRMSGYLHFTFHFVCFLQRKIPAKNEKWKGLRRWGAFCVTNRRRWTGK